MSVKTSAITVVLAAVAAIGGVLGAARAGSAKDTILGTALSPAHIPNPSGRDIDRFFDEAAQIGSHVTWIFEWNAMPPVTAFHVIPDKAKQHGLKLHLYLSPIALLGGRKTPEVPSSVGGTSFNDPKVREAYKQQVLEIAALAPDYLGLATEVNFLAQNPPEFAAFVSLVHETHRAVKQKYPEQTVTISFQWDVMTAHKQFEMLKQFSDCVDVYSFTTYPDAFGDPAKNVPADYLRAVRKLLPKERVGFSEVGWSSAPPGSEDAQAAFFARLPELTEGARFEFVTLALLHDVSLFTGELARLNHVGIRRIDDRPKKAWEVILNLPELR
jgi:hypothetical protein